MKKSTMAVAALLSILAAPVVSVAYADDTTAPAASCKGCAGTAGCKGCKGCSGTAGCKGCKGCSGNSGSATCKGCGGCSGD